MCVLLTCVGYVQMLDILWHDRGICQLTALLVLSFVDDAKNRRHVNFDMPHRVSVGQHDDRNLGLHSSQSPAWREWLDR